MAALTQVQRVRLLAVHQGLCLEAQGGRMTRKGPSCLTIAKRDYGAKGNRDAVRRYIENLMREQGGFEDYLARNGLPLTDMATHFDALTTEANDDYVEGEGYYRTHPWADES